MSKHGPLKAPKHKTNKNRASLVKVVVLDDLGKWKSPEKQQVFFIDQDAVLPTINFEIDTEQPGPYSWSWSISWVAKVSGLRESPKRKGVIKTFSEAATFTSSSKTWLAVFNNKVLGGTLTVKVATANESFKRSVYVKGTNPSEASARNFIATLPDTAGFDKIVAQESTFKNFINADHEPIVAFDKGYGMTQMTHPSPSFEEVWNWKANVKGGASLYQQKQKEAKAYLGQKGRTYSEEQLKLETWSRWNGGSYHVWDDKTSTWVRNPGLVCDPQTGNIGWNMSSPENAGQTEASLHERDKDSYSNPKKNKTSANKWTYTGICYADHVNSQ